jgi:hypothetical protein
VFSSQLEAKVSSTLVKTAVLRGNLNLDGTPITSRTHTHPSHSPTSRLLISSPFLGVPVPRPTQCIPGVYTPSLYLFVFHHPDNHMLVFFIPLSLSIYKKNSNKLLRWIPATPVGTSRIPKVLNNLWLVCAGGRRNCGRGQGGADEHTWVRKSWKRLLTEGEGVDFLVELLEMTGWPQVNDEQTEEDFSWVLSWILIDKLCSTRSVFSNKHFWDLRPKRTCSSEQVKRQISW